MYRTDKQFMKNPATAPSRIYIGGLSKAVIADDLDNKFSSHGKILGLVINSGFAFIQYESEHEAHSAIQAENGSVMLGRKIVVRQAFAPKGGKDTGPPHNTGAPVKNDTLQNRPNVPPQIMPQDEPVIEKINFEPPEGNIDMQLDFKEDEPNLNMRPQPTFDDDRGRKRMGRGGRGGLGGQQHSRDRFESRDRDMMYPEREGYYGGRRDFVENYSNPHVPPPVEACPPPAPERNDCEIIVVSRALTEYAEFIESKLKQMGLVVDLLFPNEDVPIGRVLANISSRGCLYAILVMPQNEEHRSLTLNILHSVPQEHRNMPMDDALILISRNFEAYMHGENLEVEDPNKMSLSDRHPQPVQMLINLLAENRMLSTSQYDRIVKYLQEKRELQQEHEVSEGINQDSNESNSKQTELQSRILNILNKNTDTLIPTSITAPDPTPKEAPTPLLKDPSVQKAIDSLLSGEMFKSITGNI